MIAYKTPFEIYFARNCNAFIESRLQDEILPSAGRAPPTKNERYRRSRQALKLQNRAKKATRRCDKRMQRTQLRLNPPSVYSIGEKCIYVWEGSHRINGMWRRVVSRNERSSCTPMRFHTPHHFQGRKKGNRVSVNDITSLTLEREKQKQKYVKLTKKKKKLTSKKSITCL